MAKGKGEDYQQPVSDIDAWAENVVGAYADGVAVARDQVRRFIDNMRDRGLSDEKVLDGLRELLDGDLP